MKVINIFLCNYPKHVLTTNAVVLLLTGIIVCVNTLNAIAAFKEPDPKAKVISPAEAVAIRRGLMSTDADARREAIVAIGEWMDINPRAAARCLATEWLKPLVWAGQFDLIADWTTKAECANPIYPLSLAQLDMLQSFRVRALLRSGRTNEALSASKSYYNAVRMEATSDAIRLVCLCLKADAKTSSLADKFLAEQAVSIASIPKHSVLSEIKVDRSLYQSAIERDQNKRDFHALLRLGNRLLLADDPGGARSAFERALAVAGDRPQQSMAIESIARGIKAQDGTIVRANAYILAHYPATHPTTLNSTMTGNR